MPLCPDYFCRAGDWQFTMCLYPVIESSGKYKEHLLLPGAKRLAVPCFVSLVHFIPIYKRPMRRNEHWSLYAILPKKGSICSCPLSFLPQEKPIVSVWPGLRLSDQPHIFLSYISDLDSQCFVSVICICHRYYISAKFSWTQLALLLPLTAAVMRGSQAR